MARSPRRRKLTRWIIGVVAVVVVLAVGGPFVYFHFIQADPPPKLSLDTTPVPSSAAGTTRAPLAGTWKIASGSLVRYRVEETVFGQSGTAVGTTNSVTGSLTITGTKVTAATFTVDMTTVEERREPARRPVPGPDHGHCRLPDRHLHLDEPDRSRARAEGRRADELLRDRASSNCTARPTT